MQYSFESDGATITLNHLPGRQLLYARSGAFKQNTDTFDYWKRKNGQHFSTFYGGNGRQIFGKTLNQYALTRPLCRAVKKNLAGKKKEPLSIAEVFRMENGEITAMLYEYIVSFKYKKSEIPPSGREKLGNWFHWKTLESVWPEENCYVVKARRLDLPSFFEGLKILQTYEQEVSYVHPNFVGQLNLETSDPGFSNQWALNASANVNGRSPVVTIDIGSAWTKIATLPSPLTSTPVMVLDQGVFTHNDLKFNNLSSTTSSLSHGIKVAGVMGALQNTIGITGISPDPGQGKGTAFDLIGQNFPKQFDTIATEQIAVDQATWVRDFLRTVRDAPVKPKVLNLSFNFLGYPGTRVLKSVLETLSNDMVICVSVGNYINDGQHGLEDVPGYPAYLPDIVLPVGAIDIEGRRATIANHGWASKSGFPQGQGIMAPGVDIMTTDKNNAIMASFSGTSAATAFVSGVAALMFAVNKNPNLKPSDVRRILLETATTFGLKASPALTPTYIGRGVVQAGAALNTMLAEFP